MADRDRPPQLGIGARLRAARQRLGWSREELAVHCGMSYSGIAQIESGRRRNLRPDTLTALADGLGVSIDYLVDGGARSPAMLDHRALIYRDEDEFVALVAPYLREGVERSEAVLAVTTQKNIAGLQHELGRAAGEVKFVERDRWFGEPSTALKGFRSFLNAAIKRGKPWVRVIGDPVWVRGPLADVRRWTRFESVLNVFFSSSPLTMLCAYHESSIKRKGMAQVEAMHPAVVSREGVARSDSYRDPGEFVFEV